MHSLPYELLKIIIDEVPNHQDLLRIRLVNTTFRALATPRVFRWFRVCGTAQNASAINEIARHETLAGCIQGIVFPVDHSKKIDLMDSANSFVEFWQHAVQHQVLNTLASHPQSLTEFSLHSDIDVGIVAKIDFSDLHFPALTFISLTGILFNEETHVEDFIVRHKRTLRTLSLQSCNIAIHDPIQGPPRFWSQIYTRFADVLEELMWRPILIGRYAQLDPETGYSYLVQGRVRDEDAEALKLLVARVTSRSG
ncbi:hypothetical protein HETIRDRAFT_427592 [Heterobasidion irregulare TC 32-1]|uniref:F-box domain-containing protein n=1 Tax=Heterobasidion irregulare (strain TC 32-1) TaxID=747525 RepID=W4K425_HETIT|nr:uncharacterized protein HETIRDRAFT_427592 [Heterobasidion irregulare TC 32-1]ETW80567.1 hypothetical protein HETIRDRAFT_427592 [Heterobasidion irregulare TC 32-1]